MSGATTAVNPTDDAVTVTHFSLDSWGQIEQKTTPLSPKVSNQSQNPFNPFTNDTTNNEVSNTFESSEEEAKPEDDKKKNTNPFIDSNPFLGILNPFKDLQPVTTEKKAEMDTEKVGARVVKTEEIQTTTTTLTHKVSYVSCACKPAVASHLLHKCPSSAKNLRTKQNLEGTLKDRSLNINYKLKEHYFLLKVSFIHCEIRNCFISCESCLFPYVFVKFCLNFV